MVLSSFWQVKGSMPLSLNVNLQNRELISPQYGAVHTLRYFFLPGGFSDTYKISRDLLAVSYYTYDIYGLLTKCEVKMAGYWPSSFFACFMDQDRVKVHILALAKIERGRYPAILTEQAWSINDLLYDFRGNFYCRIQRVVPSRQDSSLLPARVANHSA